MKNQNQGCLAGLTELFLLNKAFDWLQQKFGFSKGCSGWGCGVILLIIFVLLACGIITNTSWVRPF